MELPRSADEYFHQAEVGLMKIFRLIEVGFRYATQK